MSSLKSPLESISARLVAFGKAVDGALVPPVVEPGSMPWFSLGYVAFPFIPAFIPGFPVPNWGLTWLAIATFLPLYFGFHWVRGWRRIAILLAMAGLSVALVPANWFANTFLIYSNVMAAFLPLPQMVLVIVLTQAVFAVALWFLSAKLYATIFVLISLLTGVMAAFGTRFWIESARKQAALRLSQEEVQRLARVAERERIGRDLHDLLGHTLSVIALKAELAHRLFERDPQAAKREIAEVERVAREALGQVRRAVTGMRALGLRAEFANVRLALAAIEVDFEYRSEDVPLAPELESVLALALREAATNVIRHAAARRCRADFRRDGDHVELAVRDDGMGGATLPGNGLKGMRERIESLGGTMTLQSLSGRGTEIVLRIPYSAPALPEEGEATRTRPRLAIVGQ